MIHSMMFICIREHNEISFEVAKWKTGRDKEKSIPIRDCKWQTFCDKFSFSLNPNAKQQQLAPHENFPEIIKINDWRGINQQTFQIRFLIKSLDQISTPATADSLTETLFASINYAQLRSENWQHWKRIFPFSMICDLHFTFISLIFFDFRMNV